MAQFQNKRLGKYSDDDSITSLTEFTVQKNAPRHPVSLTWPVLLLELREPGNESSQDLHVAADDIHVHVHVYDLKCIATCVWSQE